MFPFSFLIAPLTIFLSLSTATGVFVHDMRIDKVAMTALAVPAVMASYQAGMHLVGAHDLHTHAEGVSLSQAVNDVKGHNPLFQPRSAHKNKKYITKRSTLTGHRALYGSTVQVA